MNVFYFLLEICFLILVFLYGVRVLFHGNCKNYCKFKIKHAKFLGIIVFIIAVLLLGNNLLAYYLVDKVPISALPNETSFYSEVLVKDLESKDSRIYTAKIQKYRSKELLLFSQMLPFCFEQQLFFLESIEKDGQIISMSEFHIWLRQGESSIYGKSSIEFADWFAHDTQELEVETLIYGMLSLFLGLLGLLGAWNLIFVTGQETSKGKMELKKIRVYILGTMFIVAVLLLGKIITPIRNTVQNNLYSESDVIFKERVAGNVFENMNKNELISWISLIPFKGVKKEIKDFMWKHIFYDSTQLPQHLISLDGVKRYFEIVNGDQKELTQEEYTELLFIDCFYRKEVVYEIERLCGISLWEAIIQYRNSRELLMN